MNVYSKLKYSKNNEIIIQIKQTINVKYNMPKIINKEQ